MKFFSCQQDTNLPETVGSKISRLIECLRKSRCLLVLDNFDLLLNNNQAGNYRVGYEEYGELLQRVGEVPHQSCLILTSQKKPAEVAALAGEIYPIRCLQLSGLNNDAGQRILAAKGISASVDDEERLIEFYCGNPLALKIAATSILDLFDGSIADFLEEVVRSPRPYENMNIIGITSLNPPQKATLKTLGALELVSNYQSTSKVLEFPKLARTKNGKRSLI